MINTEIGSNVKTARHALAIDELRRDFEPTIWQPKPGIDIKQVWFTGAHSDIGGGYPADSDGTRLSDIPLRWMMSEAKKAGLTTEPHLQQHLRANPLATLHQSRRKFYRIKKKYYRPLAHNRGPVFIHESVRERWDADPTYRKKAENLRNYIEAEGWPAKLVS